MSVEQLRVESDVMLLRHLAQPLYRHRTSEMQVQMRFSKLDQVSAALSRVSSVVGGADGVISVNVSQLLGVLVGLVSVERVDML